MPEVCPPKDSAAPNPNPSLLLGDVVSETTSRQLTMGAFLRERLETLKLGPRVLDLGCGEGKSVDLFRSIDPEVAWVGVDIEASPEVCQRRRTDARFVTFDGVQLPFEDDAFDVVFSHQVLEHVERPAELLREVRRVLRPGGRFIGSTSHLEPYHSFSYFNFSPWGLRRILEGAGFRVVRLHPGMDALTLIGRRLLGRPRWMSRYFRVESPLNRCLELLGILTRRPIRARNVSKLQYCGQFRFEATPSEGTG